MLARAPYALVVLLVVLLSPAVARAPEALTLTSPSGTSAILTSAGAILDLGDDRAATLALRSIARRGDERLVEDGRLTVLGGGLERALANGVTEWWRALPIGLEHGVTLAVRPEGEGRLALTLAITGLTPRAASDDVVLLVDREGETVARYQHLVVLDDAGRSMPARLAVVDGAIRIDVDDRGARYPLVVDPLVVTEEATVLATGRADGDRLGESVSITSDGSRILAGAASDDTAAGADAGSARVLVRSGTTWTEEAMLLSGSGAATDYFGYAVAIAADGTRAIVGAFGDDTAAGSGAGSAHVFVRSGATWTREVTLYASGAAANEWFGFSVAMTSDGSRAIVGVPFDDTARGSGAGTARVYRRSGTSWTQEATLSAGDGAMYDFLGESVALSSDGTRAVVGAYRDDTAGGVDAGSARVFVRSGTAWTEEATLVAGDGAAADELGGSAAMSADGSRVLVGAESDDTAAGSNHGSVRVFARSGTSWSEEATLTGSGIFFGSTVSLSGDGAIALIGSPEDSTIETGRGSARVFTRIGATWTDTLTLTASDAVANDAFGHSVTIAGDGTRAAIGTPYDDAGSFTDIGSVRVLRFVSGSPNGTACTSASACTSGFCTDGVCCDAACGDGASDCMACSAATGAAVDGTCGALSAAIASTVTCRAASLVCDRAETCTSASTSCPADGFVSAGTACRGPIGACDATETCTGASATCPMDAARPDGTSCADADVCNGAEACVSGTCHAASAIDCDDGNACTADACDAVSGCSHAIVAGCGDAGMPDASVPHDAAVLRDAAVLTDAALSIDASVARDAAVLRPDASARPDASVSDASGPDAGDDAATDTDATRVDASAGVDASVAPPPELSGCACRAATGAAPPVVPSFFVLALTLAIARRRR
jgi:MYXO-CTERM domain-containing protein